MVRSEPIPTDTTHIGLIFSVDSCYRNNNTTKEKKTTMSTSPNIASNVVDAESPTEQAMRYAKKMPEEAVMAQFGASTAGAGLSRCPSISVVDSLPSVSPAESLIVQDDGTVSCLLCHSGDPPAGFLSHLSHRPMPNPEQVQDADGNEQPRTRRCVICFMKTRAICAHPVCLAKTKTRKVPGTDEIIKTIKGIGLCNGNRIRPGMNRTCVEEHRFRMQQQNTA